MSSLYQLEFITRGSGLYVNERAGQTLGHHKVVYRNNAGTWSLADADLATTMPVIGITMGAIPNGNKGEILIQGYIGDAAWAWTSGDDLYASTVAGELTAVAPVGPDIVQIVAVVVEPDMIYFSSDLGSGGGGAPASECAVLEGHTAYVGINACREPQTNYWEVDGVADDVQINAALAYVTALGGGSVFLERGTYVLADPIVFTGSNLMLLGAGSDTFIDGDGLATGEHGIEISGFTDCVVKDLSIQTEDGGAKTCHCIFIEDGADRFKIDNVTVVDSDTDGIHVEGTVMRGGQIINCNILDTDEIGISVNMDGGADVFGYGVISENYLVGCGGDGINLTDGWFCLIENNTIQGSSDGDGIELNTSVSTRVEGNSCYQNTQHGIYLVDADNCIISNNSCLSNDFGDTATYDGIILDINSTNCIIEGNYVSSNDRYGISSLGARTTINGNTVSVNGRHGILIDGQNSLINNNNVFDNGQDTADTYNGIMVTANADRSNITGNMIDGFGDSQKHGIYLDGVVFEVLIEANYCYNGMGSGIYLTADSDDCVIQGNFLKNNDDYGVVIAAASCDRTRVFDNQFDENVTGAISDAGTDTATPELFLPVTGADGVIGTHPAVLLTDALSVTVYSQLMVPRGYQETLTVQALIVAAAAGDMNRSVATNWAAICTTEDYNAQTDTVAAGVVAVLANDITCVDISGAFTAIDVNDLIGIAYTRDGTAVADTIGDVCYYLGIRFRYV